MPKSKNYEEFVEKFKPKLTTDDCYTPTDVYEAVLKYVSEIYPLQGKSIFRPFWPGKDYRNEDYPPGTVVIDNPPFSIFSQIVRFYTERSIPFFLFGPGLTILYAADVCSIVCINSSITFENGAKININFATNLLPKDVLITSSHRLETLIGACPSQNTRRNLKKYNYPPNLIKISDLHTMSKGSEDFTILRHQARLVRKINCKQCFGHQIIVSDKAAKLAAAKLEAVKLEAVKLEAIKKAIPIVFSEEEMSIIQELNEAEHQKESAK